jgi:2'-5' RNA ligase
LSGEPTRRVFFALWPDEAQRAALAHATREAVCTCGGRPVPMGNLHATLSFLGGIPARRVAELSAIARAVAGASFFETVELSLESVACWGRPQVLVALPPKQPPEADSTPVHALAEALTVGAVAAGFTPDLKPFHAHVTVARKVARPPAVQALRPVRWRFDTFALIESRTHAAGAAYSIVECYPLVDSKKVRT